MISTLRVRNFKSIKSLTLKCRRVNIFIGDPNSGKSNILESISLLNLNSQLQELVRFEDASNLFFDFDTKKPFEVASDDYVVSGKVTGRRLVLTGKHGKGKAQGIEYSLEGLRDPPFQKALADIPAVRSYRYKGEFSNQEGQFEFLDSPFGRNLGSVILSNTELRNKVTSLLNGLGYRLLFRPYNYDFEILREHNDFSIAFPVSVVSDTVKRMIFYLTAIESNKDCTVLFEEPESNTFPVYIRDLAARVAMHRSNQYFITTHNPYFLQTIIEKTLTKDLSVNLVEMKNYRTEITQLRKESVEEILGLNSDVFLNFEKLKQA